VLNCIKGREWWRPVAVRALGTAPSAPNQSTRVPPVTTPFTAQLDHSEYPLAGALSQAMVAEEDAPLLFGSDVRSPSMMMAPTLLPAAARRFPAVAHADGSCRVQTVRSRGFPPAGSVLSAALHAASSAKRAIWSAQRGALPDATHIPPQGACNMQRATCNVQRATCTAQRPPRPHNAQGTVPSMKRVLR
jgi:hypothetical protein